MHHNTTTDERNASAMSAPLQRNVVRIRFGGQTFVADGPVTAGEILSELRTIGLEGYRDCTGALCIRTIADGNAHRAQVAAARDEEERRQRQYVERVHREVAALRAQRGLCLRDFQCLRKTHDGPCAHDVRTLAALGEERVV